MDFAWYRMAASNLGFISLLNLQLQRRLKRPMLSLRAKTLRYPVLARKGTSDLSVFHQIFTEREYRCLDEVASPSLIIDCGANVGYASAYFLSRYRTASVIAVEPEPDNFTMLLRNVAPYGARCRAVQAAVWWRNESLKLVKQKDGGGEWGCAVEPGSEDVRAVSIPELANGRRVSILKIDIEGAEKEVFRHQVGWLDQVDNIVIELHGDECKNSFLSALGGRHYEISTCGELTCCISRS